MIDAAQILPLARMPDRRARRGRSAVLALLATLPTLLTADAPPPRFDVIRFFTGATEGTGRLKVVLRASRGVHVTGRGRMDGDTLVLDQRVEREGVAPTNRQWRIRQVAPGRYAGTLSDAKGPITGEVGADGRLHLAFTSNDGFAVQQWLTLAGDGRSAQNRLVAKRFGVTVATLDELIRKTD